MGQPHALSPEAPYVDGGGQPPHVTTRAVTANALTVATLCPALLCTQGDPVRRILSVPPLHGRGTGDVRRLTEQAPRGVAQLVLSGTATRPVRLWGRRLTSCLLPLPRLHLLRPDSRSEPKATEGHLALSLFFLRWGN